MYGLGGGECATLQESINKLHEDIKYDVNRLESIRERLSLFTEDPSVNSPIATSEKQNVKLSSKVFVVHGHDELTKQSVARFIEKLGLEAVILHERANLGKTVIEKLEMNTDVGYAVILLTPDDIGHTKAAHLSGHPLNDRARQNVVFEHGFFIGKYGRDRVCALYKGVEIPSDLQGVLYVSLDDAGNWRFQLAKEMKAAGMPVDMNRVVRVRILKVTCRLKRHRKDRRPNPRSCPDPCRLRRKLKPIETGHIFAAVLAALLDEDWTTHKIEELFVTNSDNPARNLVCSPGSITPSLMKSGHIFRIQSYIAGGRDVFEHPPAGTVYARRSAERGSRAILPGQHQESRSRQRLTAIAFHHELFQK